MVASDLKAIAKKSKFIHSAVKMVRGARDIPREKWGNLAQLSAVFKVLPNTMLPLPRLFDAYDAVVSINKEGIQGDIVECGVWNGGCVGLMALANLKVPGPKRRFHLFDSFKGLPQPSSHDVEIAATFRRQHPNIPLQDEGNSELMPIEACVGYSQPVVEDFLVQHLGINRKDLEFHVGWFQDTVPCASKTIKDIALLRLDGDWYESTKISLEGLYEKVVKNGYIIIDDYGTFSGCATAIDDFFDKNGRPNLQHSDSECVFFRK
jgi:hypothetical protein